MRRRNETPEQMAARRTATATVWLTRLTVVLATIGVAGVWLSYDQGLQNDKQLQVAQRAAAAAASVATEAGRQVAELHGLAEQTEKNTAAQISQAALAREVSEKQSNAALNASIAATRAELRAWVGVADVKTLGKAGEIDLEILIRNSGKTPAREESIVCCSVDTVAITEPMPFADFDSAMRAMAAKREEMRHQRNQEYVKQHPEAAPSLRKREAELEKEDSKEFQTLSVGGGVVVPEIVLPFHWGGVTVPTMVNDPLQVKLNREFPNADVPIHQMPAATYLLGTIKYSDVFPGTPQHKTNFCLMRKSGVTFELCPEGNWME